MSRNNKPMSKSAVKPKINDTKSIIGIILIIVGVLLLVYSGYETFTKKPMTTTDRYAKTKKSIYRSAKSYTPSKGDIVFFGNKSHVGIVYKVSKNTLITVEGNIKCKGTTYQCQNNRYWAQHSITASVTYKNYKNNSYIIGYINMAKVTSRTKAKRMANLAYSKRNKKASSRIRKGKIKSFAIRHGISKKAAPTIWNDTKVWQKHIEPLNNYNVVIYDWCTGFMAWLFETKKVSPAKAGWSAEVSIWVSKAQRIKK